MNSVFSRPLFRGNFIQRFADGGIVSTVAGDQEPDLQQQAAGMLQDFAAQSDVTDQNIDSAEGIDDLLSSFSGQPMTAADARMQLSEYVGEEDAANTPESVLAMVQPTFEILKMAQGMVPEGGIATAPLPGDAQMGVRTPEGFTPAAPMSAPMQPMVGLAGGGDPNPYMQQYLADLQATKAALPSGYGRDEGEYWAALGMLGAGMAQGKSFAEGLSLGTQAYTPYLMEAKKNERAEKGDAVKYVIAQEEARKAAEASSASDELKFKRDVYIAGLKSDTDKTPASVKEAKAWMRSQGLDPEDAANGAVLQKGIEMFGGPSKTTIDMGIKSSELITKAVIDDEGEQWKGLRENYDAASRKRTAVKPVIAALGVVNEGKTPKFITGFGAETRLQAAQAAKLFGMDTSKIPLLGDPKVGEEMEAATSALAVDAAADLSRATNIQVGFARDAFPKLTRTPEGNLLLAQVVDRTAARQQMLFDYGKNLKQSYGFLNPDMLPAEAQPEKFKAVEFNGAKTDQPFNKEGKPIMSLEDYKLYLDKTNPILTDEMIGQLSTAAEAAPSSLSAGASLWSGIVEGAGQLGGAMQDGANAAPVGTRIRKDGKNYIKSATGWQELPN